MKNHIEIPQKIKNRISIKNIKDNIGHDLNGMYCDIYIDKKKVGYYNNDGWGGEAVISLEKSDQEKILAILEEHQWRHRMFTELGWDFYDNEEEITDHSVLEHLIDQLYNQIQKEKTLKKIAKQSEKEILYGTWYNYTRSSFKGGMTIEQMVRSYGLAKVQDYIDRNIKTKLKEGEQILNVNFEELGLVK